MIIILYDFHFRPLPKDQHIKTQAHIEDISMAYADEMQQNLKKQYIIINNHILH